MTEQNGTGGANSGSAAGAAGGNADDGGRSDGGSGFQDNPRAIGNSPAIEQRRAATGGEGAAANRFRLGDVEYSEDEVRSALSHKAQADVRARSLPSDPNGYEVKLPANFQAPEGVSFEFNMNDPAIANARKIAHARGIDQDSFSDLLGVYAATKIGEQMHVASARNAELSKLGSAGPQRIAAIQTWLKANAGADATVLVNQLGQFPHSGMVRTFERIIQRSSNQGGAQYQNGGRTQEETAGKIPGYENMSFKERRVAQMSRQISGGSGRGE